MSTVSITGHQVANTNGAAAPLSPVAVPKELRHYEPPPEGEQRVVLNGVDWNTYITIGEQLRDHPVRLTYDRGSLEIMVVGIKHESPKSVLMLMVGLLFVELDMDFRCGGNMTFQREDLERGMEPDECYWIEHELQMRGKEDYDPHKDPPPDLGIEIEITHPIGSRMSIYAAMRIPELWRYAGQKIRVYLLDANGNYQESETSRAFPFLPMAEMTRFLNMRTQMSEAKLLREFRNWIRAQVASNWASA